MDSLRHNAQRVWLSVDVRAVNSLHQSLRRSCEAAHSLAEAYTPFYRPTVEHAEMGPMLAHLELLWAALERRVSRDKLALEHRGIELVHHMRLPLLQADRSFWGATAPKPHAFSDVVLAPAVRAPGCMRAAGCLYVLAGARLGGAIVGRRLKETLFHPSQEGLSFWLKDKRRARPALTLLMRQLAASFPSAIETQQIIAAARATFASYSSWMGGISAHAKDQSPKRQN